MEDQNQQAGIDTNRIQELRAKALLALLPVMDQIDEKPERKFEILMTAVRTTGEIELLEKACETALTIENPSAKAEALIDIVNETSFKLEGTA